MSQPSQPWWERYGLCSERRDAQGECSYTTYVNMQCRVDDNGAKGGPPMRKCEKIIRKFRDCGRGPEEMEVTTEELTDHNFRSQSSDPSKLFRDKESAHQAGGALEAGVGEVLEEFVEYAEKLKRRTAGEGDNIPFDEQYTASQKRGTQHFGVPNPLYDEPWYSRLFHRKAQCSPGRQRPWDYHKKDFQEV